MKVANLKVQLANGISMKALGLFKNFKNKVLDHYVYYTFTVMDFNDKPCSYKMFLHSQLLFQEPNTYINYCKDLQKDIDIRIKDYTRNHE